MKIPIQTILIYLSCFTFSNCYFNPIVNSILAPPETKDNNAFLGLLGMNGQTGLITGQIRNEFGVAVAGLSLNPSNPSLQSKANIPMYTTDSGGRFYIPYFAGRIVLNVVQNEVPYFTLSLNVSSPNTITAEVSNTSLGIEISNLKLISATSPTDFFELIGLYFIDGEMNEVSLDKQNYYSTLGSIVLKFNMAPANVESNNLTFIQNAIQISPSPSVGYQALGIVDNKMSFVGAEGFTMNTRYNFQVTDAIQSSTGISLTPRKVQFCYEPSIPCSF
ncbi:hypothetical protein LFX15_00765 [Leptospira levettii]|uniref:hypothetical protein n=1 Tax=Leptospira levettii TaxID=2023178 RepID=UPI001EEACAE0|nr:hypothetical protein [Leptospira levettii]MCG6146801.1 hypothetical protein [Leptospira levettii]MCW7506880.1 hypothetical protein [Leptospira levettii]MCW7517970.1 hypothetical protein [Leptospira levettii]